MPMQQPVVRVPSHTGGMREVVNRFASPKPIGGAGGIDLGYHLVCWRMQTFGHGAHG